jgi:tRNA dimethylallyltransferase
VTGAVPSAALPVLLLAGPTGVGKSDWALALARAAPVEIVSVDSAQVYRGLDIGSAKPTPAVRGQVAHHLIDICDPTENYSAGRFVRDALAAIAAIHARRRVPLLVGGTMLYLRALIHGLAPLPQATPALRAALDARAAREGWAALHAQLAGLDPEAAARIAPTDRQRIQRALEVSLSAGRPMSQLQRATASPLAAFAVHYCLLVPGERAALHERLARRLNTMMTAGFLDEVRQLRARGDLTAHHAAMRAVGYRQLWAHLDGEYGRDEAVARALAATRQLAKRQLTWIRSERDARRLDPDADLLSWIRDTSAQLATFGL